MTSFIFHEVECGVEVHRGLKIMTFIGADFTRLVEGVDNWQNGMLIQNALPELTSEEREFLMTGLLPEEWNAIFDNNED